MVSKFCSLRLRQGVNADSSGSRKKYELIFDMHCNYSKIKVQELLSKPSVVPIIQWFLNFFNRAALDVRLSCSRLTLPHKSNAHKIEQCNLFAIILLSVKDVTVFGKRII